VKNEDDAMLAFSVSSALITSLVAYKVRGMKNLDSANLVSRNIFGELIVFETLQPREWSYKKQVALNKNKSSLLLKIQK